MVRDEAIGTGGSGGGSDSLSPQQERALRLFVSSTFRDMAADRNHLIRHVFPALRRLCEKRGVVWSEVDLRWGVTDEQAAEGRVLPICLSQIDRCRPFFIGLLGERFGWIPDEIPQDLIERYPWLASEAGRSVTEIEFESGALSQPAADTQAFFYLRDPAYTARAGAEAPEEFDERATGLPDAEERAGRLEGLKRRISASGYPVRPDYRDPEHLGELVLEDLTKTIDSLFPEDGANPLLTTRAQHEALLAARTSVYVARPEHFEALDDFVESGAAPAFAVLGPSGFGKSSLLASWAAHHRKRCPDDLTIVHFVGCSQVSADPELLLRRLTAELAAEAGVSADSDLQGVDEIRAEFARVLGAAASERRVVLVIDGLNQLVDRPGARDLAFLPR